ncbi:MAG: type II toxin-antitoxin system RelB/DinJ family antitoxin [Candidatus Paceibacteria bacterium]
MSKNTSTTLQIRIDSETKAQAQKVFSDMGIDMSSAIKLFLRNVIITESIPLELRSEKGMLAERKCDLLKEAAKERARK